MCPRHERECVCVCQKNCVCVKELCGTEVCAKVWCKNVLCVKVCTSVVGVIMLCSHNRCANTMSRGEWQPPVLACAMWPNAQTVMTADGLQQVLSGCTRLPLRTATPATQSESRCRLPRKVKADVSKRHACHTSNRSDNGVKRDPRAPPNSEPAQCHKRHACHAK